jgi:hypothetical protein
MVIMPTVSAPFYAGKTGKDTVWAQGGGSVLAGALNNYDRACSLDYRSCPRRHPHGMWFIAARGTAVNDAAAARGRAGRRSGAYRAASRADDAGGP